MDLRLSQAVATRRLTCRIANGMNRIRILVIARYHIAANLVTDRVISQLPIHECGFETRIPSEGSAAGVDPRSVNLVCVNLLLLETIRSSPRVCWLDWNNRPWF